MRSQALTRRYGHPKRGARPSKNARVIMGVVHSNTGLTSRMNTRRVWDTVRDMYGWNYPQYSHAMHEMVINGWADVNAEGIRLSHKGSDTIFAAT